MLRIFFLTMIVLNTAFAGHEFSFTYTEDQADIKIYEVDSPLQADIQIFLTNKIIDSSKCWLNENDSNGEESLKVLKVDEPSLADIKVYFVNSLEESSDRCY